MFHEYGTCSRCQEVERIDFAMSNLYERAICENCAVYIEEDEGQPTSWFDELVYDLGFDL